MGCFTSEKSSSSPIVSFPISPNADDLDRELIDAIRCTNILDEIEEVIGGGEIIIGESEKCVVLWRAASMTGLWSNWWEKISSRSSTGSPEIHHYAIERRVSSAISGRQAKRTRMPVVPMPRVTCIFASPLWLLS